jgi:hypothetical protein
VVLLLLGCQHICDATAAELYFLLQRIELFEAAAAAAAAATPAVANKVGLMSGLHSGTCGLSRNRNQASTLDKLAQLPRVHHGGDCILSIFHHLDGGGGATSSIPLCKEGLL